MDLDLTNLKHFNLNYTVRLGTSTHNGTANIRDVSGWYHFMFTWDHTVLKTGTFILMVNKTQQVQQVVNI